MTTLGFLINPAPTRPAASLLEQFRAIPTPHISDNMSRLCGTIGLTRLNQHGILLGTAFTVKTRPGDNLMVHKALDLAQPGDVLVVDGGGDLNNALVGEIMLKYAMKRGLSGFVVEGAVRDTAAYTNSDFPCYARDNTHRGPYKEGPGEINVPVNIGGLVISPGDIVIGDADGLVAFPPDQARQILALALREAAAEAKIIEAIEQDCWDRSWVDRALRAKGFEI
jgi:RraA family protein